MPAITPYCHYWYAADACFLLLIAAISLISPAFVFLPLIFAYDRAYAIDITLAITYYWLYIILFSFIAIDICHYIVGDAIAAAALLILLIADYAGYAAITPHATMTLLSLPSLPCFILIDWLLRFHLFITLMIIDDSCHFRHCLFSHWLLLSLFYAD